LLEDGVAVGSALAGIRPQRPDRVFALVTVLSEHRGCGAGSGLYETISAWAADHGLEQIDTSVEEEDLESFAFAERRGFVEIERDRRMVLDLARVGEEVALRQRYEQLRATNELRNEPIRRLNARLGYREERGRVFLLGPLGTIGAA
jgi:GNAT superfamily N-acetyltransferase